VQAGPDVNLTALFSTAEVKRLTGMNAQQASLVTRVPSGQTAVSVAGAALDRAARETRARRETKLAIGAE
jgi:hypothetical protein